MVKAELLLTGAPFAFGVRWCQMGTDRQPAWAPTHPMNMAKKVIQRSRLKPGGDCAWRPGYRGRVAARTSLHVLCALTKQQHTSQSVAARAWQCTWVASRLHTLTASSPPDAAALAAAAAHTTLRCTLLRCARPSAKVVRAGAKLSQLAFAATARRGGADLQAVCSTNQQVVRLSEMHTGARA